jgi:hypothetical protein
MSLEEIYYVSQIVAAVAIIVSLIYLAVQTHQTANNQRAMMHESRVQSIRETFEKIGDPAFASAYRAGLVAEPGMDDSACHQFAWFARGQMNHVQEVFLQWREGMVDEGRWNITWRVNAVLFAYPGVRAVYRLVRGNLHPDFVALIDSNLVEAKGKAPPRDFALAWSAVAAQERAAMEAEIERA